MLRIADVIGQRDSTERFWFYLMWLQYLNESFKHSIKHDVLIPEVYYNKKTSYVYVKDIARVINAILSSDLKNEILNVGEKHYDEKLLLT